MNSPSATHPTDRPMPQHITELQSRGWRYYHLEPTVCPCPMHKARPEDSVIQMGQRTFLTGSTTWHRECFNSAVAHAATGLEHASEVGPGDEISLVYQQPWCMRWYELPKWLEDSTDQDGESLIPAIMPADGLSFFVEEDQRGSLHFLPATEAAITRELRGAKLFFSPDSQSVLPTTSSDHTGTSTLLRLAKISMPESRAKSLRLPLPDATGNQSKLDWVRRATFWSSFMISKALVRNVLAEILMAETTTLCHVFGELVDAAGGSNVDPIAASVEGLKQYME